MNKVSIVTIKEKAKLFKKEELAERVELVKLEELGFPLVSGKDLYDIGDTAVFIEPDYCLPDSELFNDFIRPQGDINKSILGRVGGEPRRIRAKKFSLSLEPNGDAVYSYGILLPTKIVLDFLNVSTLDGLDLETRLGIYKYVEPEEVEKVSSCNGKNLEFPTGVYKTDEDNIYNVKNKIKFPIKLVGRVKEDGSSITLGRIEGDDVICSRKQKKQIYSNIVTGQKPKTFLQKLLFWKKYDLSIYESKLNSTDAFVKFGNNLLETKVPVIDNFLIRGEISGSNLKGSGNKNNPAAKRTVDIRAFGLDLIIDGVAVKQPNARFEKFCSDNDLLICSKVFEKEFNTFDEIIDSCNDYFKDNLIEGIVVRDLNSSFSAKVMNLEYDSKK